MIDLRKTSYYNETSILRKEYLEKLLSWKDKNVIKVITGIRRCGKSIVLRDFCKEISKSVVENQQLFQNLALLEFHLKKCSSFCPLEDDSLLLYTKDDNL